MSVKLIITVLLVWLLLLSYGVSCIVGREIPKSDIDSEKFSSKDDYWGPNYYIDKKYTIVFFADGSKNKSNGKPSMTNLWHLSDDFISDLKSSTLSELSLIRDLEMYHYLKNNDPPEYSWLAVYIIRSITEGYIKNNKVPRGILIIMGHFSPSTYASYSYDFDSEKKNTPILFPPKWADKTTKAGCEQISVDADSIAEDMRNKPWEKLPAMVLLLGCNSVASNYNERGTWRWAFRFSKIDNDFPDYWIGRALIGAETGLKPPQLTYWSKFIQNMLDELIHNAKSKNIMTAIDDAVERTEEYIPILNYSLIVRIDWVDDQGYGYKYYEISNSMDNEILHVFTYANLFIDPSSIEMAKIKAREISIDWIRNYLRIHFPALYYYLNENGFVIEKVTNMLYDSSTSRSLYEDSAISIENARKLNHTYIVEITSGNISIRLHVDTQHEFVKFYKVRVEDTKQNIERLFGKNISLIWSDNAYWVKKIKDLGVELKEKRVGSDAYFWNNNRRGYQVQIIYSPRVNDIPLGYFEVHHYNKSSFLVKSGIVPEVMYRVFKYYASANIEYYSGYTTYVSYWNELPELYHELYKVKDKIRELHEKTIQPKYDSQIQNKINEILSEIGKYRVTSIEFVYALYNSSFTPAYLVNGHIKVRDQPYIYTLIIFPEQNIHYLNMIMGLGCLCLEEQGNLQQNETCNSSCIGPSNIINVLEDNDNNTVNTTWHEDEENTNNTFLLVPILFLLGLIFIGLLFLKLFKRK